jgi:hypothetical protein
MINTETCKALELLEKSEIIEVEDKLLHNWHLDTLDCRSDEIVFECSFTDEEGYIFEYLFSKEALLEAVIKYNVITMKDDIGEDVEVSCYSLTPVVSE